MTLGEYLYDVRINHLKIGLREIARKLNRSPSYLSNIENDERSPEKESTLRELAEVYCVDYDQLRILSSNTIYLEKTKDMDSLQLNVARSLMSNNLSRETLLRIRDFLECEEDYTVE